MDISILGQECQRQEQRILVGKQPTSPVCIQRGNGNRRCDALGLHVARFYPIAVLRHERLLAIFVRQAASCPQKIFVHPALFWLFGLRSAQRVVENLCD